MSIPAEGTVGAARKRDKIPDLQQLAAEVAGRNDHKDRNVARLMVLR